MWSFSLTYATVLRKKVKLLLTCTICTWMCKHEGIIFCNVPNIVMHRGWSLYCITIALSKILPGQSTGWGIAVSLTCYSNHQTLLARCRNNKIIPNGLQVNLPVCSTGVYHIRQLTRQARTRSALDRGQLVVNHNSRQITSIEEKVLALGLSNVISASQFPYIIHWTATKTKHHCSIVPGGFRGLLSASGIL